MLIFCLLLNLYFRFYFCLKMISQFKPFLPGFEPWMENNNVPMAHATKTVFSCRSPNCVLTVPLFISLFDFSHLSVILCLQFTLFTYIKQALSKAIYFFSVILCESIIQIPNFIYSIELIKKRRQEFCCKMLRLRDLPRLLWPVQRHSSAATRSRLLCPVWPDWAIMKDFG